MEKFSSLSIFLFFILLFTACERDKFIFESVPEPEPEILEGQVDDLLLPFFEQFEIEAAARGISIDLAAQGITGGIEEIRERFVAGTCTYGTHLPGDVVIDLGFWNNSSELAKEMVVFHELGHCYLRRGHKESAFSNGVCTSIMRSGSEGCRDNYNNQTREFYIDELFFGED